MNSVTKKSVTKRIPLVDLLCDNQTSYLSTTKSLIINRIFKLLPIEFPRSNVGICVLLKFKNKRGCVRPWSHPPPLYWAQIPPPFRKAPLTDTFKLIHYEAHTVGKREVGISMKCLVKSTDIRRDIQIIKVPKLGQN